VQNDEVEEKDESTGVHDDDDDDESTGVRHNDENMIEEEMNGRYGDRNHGHNLRPKRQPRPNPNAPSAYTHALAGLEDVVMTQLSVKIA
jgi:hypothetical protein